ncbi:45 kDa calcium-binding protein isoform X2 [Aphidius gifuensis]|uniref:45 kDa calcium-binding protein isoform X2 n=1 Tax=Aphidius gifuensis TaxID=684658 RepID=UPI001CDCE31C|nr:45 kDa calcium-binding protein isoform X2 [Aphidius gifuensis]
MRKLDLKFLRITRWTVFVPLFVYICFLLIKYNSDIKLNNENSSEDEKKLKDLLFNLPNVADDNADSYNKNHTYKQSDIINEIEKAENQENPRFLLEDVFHRADANENSELDIHELSRWIHKKIVDHIDRAMRENIGLFTAIDNNPRNGEISWNEYHSYFLRSHGLSESYILSHNKRHGALTRSLKESIMRDRARWTETARNDPDILTLDEFLSFTHPESSHRALLQMVEDLFEKFEDEFADLPVDSVALELHEEPRPKAIIGGSEGRRQEFRYLIDKNSDGMADRTELLVYIDPRNPRHAIQEAQHLIDVSDTNHNKRLTLSEVLSKADLFLGSKMVDTEKSFHDEFKR